MQSHKLWLILDDIEVVKEIKILGAVFKNKSDPNTSEQWKKVLNKIIERQAKSNIIF